MSLMGKTLTRGDLVRHTRFGIGTVRLDEGETAIVRFDDAVHECDKADLESVATPLQQIFATPWHSPIDVITRAQAAAIESVNDMWGVLSTSRIVLLPHQLWVCRRVLETWPTRWLVADDVGLGKTIEAGLVFWPLIARGTVRRLLIICPASLVEQWGDRLRTMFDIRVAIYAGDADTERTDFWGTHHMVAGSLQRLRLEGKGRHRRLLDSDPWDLVVVDEAHHLNADEKGGPTLGYQLLEKLVENNRVKSLLFFTGTPHRGKNFGFLSLLKLLRPDLFDPKEPLEQQLPQLCKAMIRNNKQNVTDLKGNRLFHPPVVTNHEFEFSAEEREFYEQLTDFIRTGRAYASSLDATTGKAVTLVLIAMQKLASSSVAAIRRALRGRLARIAQGRARLEELQARRDTRLSRLGGYSDYAEYEKQGDLDALSRLEEEIAELSGELRLMENEEPQLRELVVWADRVGHETKIDKILAILRKEFTGRQVLFFTEYKATQSLLMSALMGEFGEDSVTFINGDDRADEVVFPSGQMKSVTQPRAYAADRFNAGQVRFLVSTEAGGEGIDLQESCHSLIHVDLPWNPMRLHQRVGRLNRYGQKKQVEVIVLRNPETVEGRIWEILQEKMNQIMLALGHAMDEPEDLLQLVLGMTSPTLWREIYSEAPKAPGESLAQWFNHRTAQFGNEDVIKTVQDLVGNCAKFDYQEVSNQLPKVDLPALRPFFLSMLKINRRRAEEKADGLAFLTPEAWQTEPGIYPAYEAMIFRRDVAGRDGLRRVLGVGHKLVSQALRQAREISATVATLPTQTLTRPLIVYQIRDKVTGEQRTVRSVTLAVEIDEGEQGADVLLKDWELLEKLNGLVGGRGFRAKGSAPPGDMKCVEGALNRGMSLVRDSATALGLPFRIPEIEPLIVLWPLSGSGKESELVDEEEGAGDDDETGPVIQSGMTQ
jgi:superfamily II DNA or RNA helicase